MIIFKDMISGDELLSDSYDLKEVEGAVYEANGQMITRGAVNVDTGANASAEEPGEEASEDAEAKVIDLVDSFRLQSTSFDKKSYLSHLKGYFKAIKAKMTEAGKSAEEVAEFEKTAGAYAKKIVGNFKDYEFYVGESMDPDGMVVLLNYREDGMTPYITIWKHGLSEVKV